MWPKLRGTIHSGGRLCALAKIPACPVPLSGLSSWGDVQQPEEDKQQARVQVTLLAAGEYNGRGTLEIYPLRTTAFRARSSLPTGTHPVGINATRNRQTASRSKLLTLASHGARIVTGDGDGVIKWVERDGRTVVRVHLVETPEKKKRSGAGGLWGNSGAAGTAGRIPGHLPAGGEAVRKIIVAKDGGEELVVWAGGRVGVLGSFGDEEFEEEEKKDGKGEDEMETYLERMREVLQRQAAEVRIMAGLGMRGI